jgi:GMP synthase-like glutamine amidotransferase
MKDIAIFRHAPTEGPGYFATFLSERKIPYRLIKIDEGNSVPTDASPFSGLVFMGGPMSVNDDLPWISPVLDLIRQAVGKDIPVLGHCLGGQLMAKALGGVVTRNSVKEIGWGVVRVTDNSLAREWFAEGPSEFDAFHWHGETFSLPQGATRILESSHCANQAFVLGKHLGMQCHVEMTEDMIRAWCAVGADEIAGASASPAVQGVAAMQAEMADKLPRLNKVAATLYAHWLKGIPQ